jgi:hypothetical protein
MTARLLFLSLVLATSLNAQQKTTPRWVLGAELGGASAVESFGGVGGGDWKSGWSAGANLLYHLNSKIGIRGDANFAQNGLSGGAVPGEGRLNKLTYMGNVVLSGEGGPLGDERLTPYGLAGLGAVTIHAKGSDSTFTTFGGDIGFGFGYRLGRLGLRAEGRDVMYKFERFGYNKGQNDVVWEGGVTLAL